jgi:spore coat polysaccharide biosynthesis protein SpsF
MLGSVPRIVGIVAARLDSTRLPAKALREVAGRPLLGHVVGRARRIAGLDGLVLATTARAVDDPLADWAGREGLDCFRGDLEDVAGRFLACARRRGAEAFVRLNADSPFLDPALVDEGLRASGGDADLVSNLPGRSFPYGISVEVVRTSALERAHGRMTAEERVHVTAHFYAHPEEYRIVPMTCPDPSLRTARLVVDTEEDLRRFASVAARLADRVTEAGYREVAALYLQETPR